MAAGAMGDGRGEGGRHSVCQVQYRHDRQGPERRRGGCSARTLDKRDSTSGQGSSSVKGRLPLKAVFHQRTSSVKGRLLSKVVLCQRSSSIEGCLPLLGHFHFCPAPCAFQQCASRLLSKVVFRQWSSFVKGRLPSKVVFSHRSSPVKICFPSKVVFLSWVIIIFGF